MEPDRFKVPKEMDEMLPNYLSFALLWGIGGPLHESVRPAFNEALFDAFNGENLYEKFKLDMRIPLKAGQEFEPLKLNINVPADAKNLYDIYYDDTKLGWVNWVKTIP